MNLQINSCREVMHKTSILNSYKYVSGFIDPERENWIHTKTWLMKTVKWKTKFIEYVCCNQIIHIVIHIPLNFSYAGLHCVVIKGYSKSAGYQPGVKFEDNRFRNSWNAVYVAGAWRFVQCNWGARHLVNAKEVPKPGRAKSDSLR